MVKSFLIWRKYGNTQTVAVRKIICGFLFIFAVICTDVAASFLFTVVYKESDDV